MWQETTHQLNPRLFRTCIAFSGVPVTYGQTLQLWKEEFAFRSYFTNLLAQTPFVGFRWETPAVTTLTLHQPFEFVLSESPGLERTPDPHAFREHFAAAPANGIVKFRNLGNDATLIVPTPGGPVSSYGHLAAFLRHGPALQIHAMWECIADTMNQRLAETPVWLSTAGAGVAWLHVRLDDYPKYYSHTPYR